SPRGSFLLVTGELADTPGLQSMLVNNDISQVVRHQLWRGPATVDLNGNVVWRIEEGFEKLNPVTGVTELIPTCGNGLGLVVQIQPLNEDKMLIVASESQERFAVKLLFDSGSRIVYRGNGLAVLDPSEHGLFSIVDIEGDRLKTFDLDGTLTDNVAFCVKDAVPDDWDWKA